MYIKNKNIIKLNMKIVEIIGLNSIRMIGIDRSDLSFFINDKLVLNMYQAFDNLSKKPMLFL